MPVTPPQAARPDEAERGAHVGRRETRGRAVASLELPVGGRMLIENSISVLNFKSLDHKRYQIDDGILTFRAQGADDVGQGHAAGPRRIRRGVEQFGHGAAKGVGQVLQA